MIDKLDASCFHYNPTFQQHEFENLLQGIISCYQCIIAEGKAVANNENIIRDLMLNQYLKVEVFKQTHNNLANYHFDAETVENNGRADIRILPIHNYINDRAYFIIECKRLNNQNLEGVTGLNAEYIKNGICRFVSGHYTCYFGINGMIGFIVEDLDIEKIIRCINLVIDRNLINNNGHKVNANCIHKIEPFIISEDFKNTYISKHEDNKKNEILLYHLMLDFSRNML